jgi:hypothetical protein
VSKNPTKTASLKALSQAIIPADLGMLTSFQAKILALGIEPETNAAILTSGMYATTFVIPEKKIVIKFFEKEPDEANVAFLPNASRYALQPFCHTSILGNRLMIFPMLDVGRANSGHIATLCDELKKEGYYLDDDKISNVGLSFNSTPYVIDEDAVKTAGGTQTTASTRENQWKIIDPFFARDAEVDLSKSGWVFDDLVLQKMSGPFGSAAQSNAAQLDKSHNAHTAKY